MRERPEHLSVWRVAPPPSPIRFIPPNISFFQTAIFYHREEVTRVINNTAGQLRAERGREVLEVPGQGSFALRRVHDSWARELMLGAFDYYHKAEIAALQLVPDRAHCTIDMPDLSKPWNAALEPVWQLAVRTVDLPGARGLDCCHQSVGPSRGTNHRGCPLGGRRMGNVRRSRTGCYRRRDARGFPRYAGWSGRIHCPGCASGRRRKGSREWEGSGLERPGKAGIVQWEGSPSRKA
jgi:hypothetical protein